MYKFGANSVAFYFDKIGFLNVIYIVYSAINGYYNEITCKNYVFWYLGIFEKYLFKKIPKVWQFCSIYIYYIYTGNPSLTKFLLAKTSTYDLPFKIVHKMPLAKDLLVFLGIIFVSSVFHREFVHFVRTIYPKMIKP